MNSQDFIAQLADAYEHLYDLVYLRTHALADLLVHEPGLSRKEVAWRLHHILLNIIEELNPGDSAPVFSREWRRYQLMLLRYVDGLLPQAVADQLVISRRSYYRAHEAAIDALASILQNRYLSAKVAPVPQPAPDATATDRLELIRLEVARFSQQERYTHFRHILDAGLALLQDGFQQRRMRVEVDEPDALPGLAVDQQLLRQLLLGVLGYLSSQVQDACLHIEAESKVDTAELLFTVHPPLPALQPAERQSDLQALAQVSGLSLLPITDANGFHGFQVDAPIMRRHTILVVDDNQDIRTLFQRHLGAHYQVVTASTGAEALHLAETLQPFAITLDLMMPDQDGWDLLQHFIHQPATRAIPIIVCSVLRQKELALSLGATAFLEKPVTEDVILSLLKSLETQHEQT